MAFEHLQGCRLSLALTLTHSSLSLNSVLTFRRKYACNYIRMYMRVCAHVCFSSPFNTVRGSKQDMKCCISFKTLEVFISKQDSSIWSTFKINNIWRPDTNLFGVHWVQWHVNEAATYLRHNKSSRLVTVSFLIVLINWQYSMKSWWSILHLSKKTAFFPQHNTTFSARAWL